MTGGTDDDRPYYGRARIAGGLLLLGTAATLAVIDAFSLDYTIDSIVFGLLLGTGGILLGVESLRKRLGPNGD